MKIKLNLDNIIKLNNNMNFESMSKKEIKAFCSENEIEIPETVTKKSHYINYLTENFDFEEEEEIIEIEEDVEVEEEEDVPEEEEDVPEEADTDEIEVVEEEVEEPTELVLDFEEEEEDDAVAEDILNISSVESTREQSPEPELVVEDTIEEDIEEVEEVEEEDDVVELNMTNDEEGEDELIEEVEVCEIDDDDDEEVDEQSDIVEHRPFVSRAMLMVQLQTIMDNMKLLYTPELVEEEVHTFSINDDGKRTTYSDMNVQTDNKEYVDQETQVQPEVCEVEVQTDNKKMKDTQSQTITKKFCEIQVQTDTVVETTPVITAQTPVPEPVTEVRPKKAKKVKACSIKKCNNPRETKSKFCSECNQKIRDGKIKIKSKK